jgi:hypothetical protein
MFRRVKSPSIPESPQLLTIGLCATGDQEARLQAAGVKHIYRLGRGLENLHWALDWLRGRGGVLKVATDLRIFGATRATMMAALDDCERKGVTVIDIAHPEDVTLTQRIKRALVAISSARFIGDRRKARREGSKGGLAKGASAWIVRNEIAPRWLIQNMVTMFGAVKAAAALDNKISVSTLRRKYVAQPST